MGVDPNWSLSKGNNALTMFQTGAKIGDQIRQSREKGELRKAVAAAASNPADPKALEAVMALDPETGVRLAEHQHKRAEWARDDQFRTAQTDYLTPTAVSNPQMAAPNPGQNALAAVGLSPSPSQPGAQAQGSAPMPNAQSIISRPDGTPAQMPQQNALAPFSQPQGNWPSPDRAPQLPDSRQEQPDPELAFLGQPDNARDRAFLRMVKIDPVKALKLRSTMRDNFVQSLKDTQTLYEVGIDRLSNVSDDTGYQRVLAELAPMSQAIGGNLLDHVPANYPGPDGIRELTMKALDAKDRVAAFREQNNISADNERADRNTESLIADREGRRGEVRRNHNIQSANAQRGQNIRAGGGGHNRSNRDDRGGTAPKGPVRVKSVEEARGLPPGTEFRTPDGRVMRTKAR